jgi:hypothetical protein
MIYEVAPHLAGDLMTGDLSRDADQPNQRGSHQAMGDTLVVDVVGFNDGSWIDMAGDPHTEQLHVIERYTRKDLYTLRYEAIIDDPGAYTEPWTIGFDIVWDERGEIQAHLVRTAPDAEVRRVRAAPGVAGQER